MPTSQQDNDGWIDVPAAAPQPKAADIGVALGGVRGAQPASTDDGWVDVPSSAQSTKPDADGWVDVPTPVTSGDAPVEQPEAPRADTEALGASRDGGGTGIVYGADLESLGATHGVDPSELRGWVGYLTGTLAPEARDGVEHVTEGLKSTAGVMSGGLVAGLAKKWAVADESKRRALDDLAALIDERKSGLTVAGEMAAGMAAPAIGGVTRLASGASKAVRTGIGLAEAAGLGSAYGYAGSREGEELQGAAVGAGIGLGFGAIAGKLASKLESRAAARLAKEAPEAVAKMEEGAGDAVTAAGRAYEAVQDAESALKQAVLHASAVREAARTRDSVKFMDSTTPEQRSLLAQLADPSTKLPRRLVQAHGEDSAKAYMAVREATEQFDRQLGVGSRRGGVRDRIAQEGLEHVESQFMRQRQAKYLDAELMRLPGSSAAGTGILSRVTRVMSDLRYVTDAVDRRLQTRLTPDLDRLSASFNRMTDDLRSAALIQRGLHKVLLAAEGDVSKNGQKFDMYAALSEPADAISKYSPKQQDAIRAWRAGWESLRELANKRGVPIQKLTDESGKELSYVYHKAVDPVEFVRRMEAKGDDLGVGLNRVVDGEYRDVPDEVIAGVLQRAEAGDAAAVEFVSGLKLAGGSEVKSATQARAALNSLADTARVGHNLETVAGAALQRGGADGEARIPEFLRERDVSKLFMPYANSTLRHAHLRGDLDAMRGWAQAIERRDPVSAAYIRNYIEDLVGVRSGSAAELRGKFGDRLQLAAMRRARRATGQAEKTFYTAIARVPDLMPRVSQHMYSYYLGAKLHKVLENVTSPFTVGLASTGARSTGHWLGGTADVIRAWSGKGGAKRMKQELVERGLMPADQPFEAHRWMREGLERSPVKRLGTKALDGLNRFVMFAYQQSDAITRGITLNTSKRFASGMQRGDATAMRVLDDMSPGYRAEVQELLGRGEDPTDSIARWLNGYTQFNYNRASMSEYGRFMGGLFSTFSKWPTSTFGEIAYRVGAAHDSGVWTPHMTKLAQKYFGPWIALQAVSRVIRAEGDVERAADPTASVPSWQEMNPQLAQAVPDPGRLSPFGTLGGLVTSAPGPRGAYDVSKKIVDGQPNAAAAAALRAALPFAPGSVVLRFFVEDLPAWGGETPQAKTAPYILQEMGLRKRQ